MGERFGLGRKLEERHKVQGTRTQERHKVQGTRTQERSKAQGTRTQERFKAQGEEYSSLEGLGVEESFRSAAGRLINQST